MSKTNPNSYYDIEFEVEEVLFRNGLVEDIFYLKDLKQRKLFIAANISQETVEDAVRHIMQFNREDADITAEERKPIILYVSSNGGDVDAGFELIDVIMNSKTPVYTINLGYQYSMGFLIGLAGHKRYAMPNAKFLCKSILDSVRPLCPMMRCQRSMVASGMKISTAVSKTNTSY